MISATLRLLKSSLNPQPSTLNCPSPIVLASVCASLIFGAVTSSAAALTIIHAPVAETAPYACGEDISG